MSVDAASSIMTNAAQNPHDASIQPEVLYAPDPRAQVQDAFNASFSRWKDVVQALLVQLDPTGEKDFVATIRLVDQGQLTEEQKKNVVDFFLLQQAVHALTGGKEALCEQKKDTITKSFQVHPQGGLADHTNAPFVREEHINIEPLLQHIAKEIGWERDHPTIPGSTKRYDDLRKEHEVLLGFTTRETLDVDSLEGHSRLAKEARQIYENPLRATGNEKTDWQEAERYLTEARCLRIPENA